MLVQKTREQRLKKEIHIKEESWELYPRLAFCQGNPLSFKQYLDNRDCRPVSSGQSFHFPMQSLQRLIIQADRRDGILKEIHQPVEFYAQPAIVRQMRSQVQTLQQHLIDQTIFQPWIIRAGKCCLVHPVLLRDALKVYSPSRVG